MCFSPLIKQHSGQTVCNDVEMLVHLFKHTYTLMVLICITEETIDASAHSGYMYRVVTILYTSCH